MNTQTNKQMCDIRSFPSILEQRNVGYSFPLVRDVGIPSEPLYQQDRIEALPRRLAHTGHTENHCTPMPIPLYSMYFKRSVPLCKTLWDNTSCPASLGIKMLHSSPCWS